MEGKLIVDGEGLKRTINRIAFEIVERNKELSDLSIVGIERRGVVLARRIADKINEIDGIDIPCGSLNITMHRDDLPGDANRDKLKKPDIQIEVAGRKVVLVDDVLYTGRSVRAAMDTILSKGRPASIQLAVIVDRGHRELPIRADYVGKNIPTSREEVVHVLVNEYDGAEGVVLEKQE